MIITILWGSGSSLAA